MVSIKGNYKVVKFGALVFMIYKLAFQVNYAEW